MIRKALQFKIVPSFGTNKIPITVLFFNIFFNSFICFWTHWVFVAALGLSLIAASGVYLLLQRTGFSSWWLFLSRSTGSRSWASVVVACGLSSYGSQALEHWPSSCGAWTLAARRREESSWTRGQTHVPCTGSWTLIHCTTRKVPPLLF